MPSGALKHSLQKGLRAFSRRPFFCLLLMLCLAVSCSQHPAAIDVTKRPAGGSLVHDYAKVLGTEAQYAQRMMQSLRQRHGIDAMLVTVPTIKGAYIEDFAQRLMEGWRIGSDTSGRGMLILYASAEDTVRMEMGYELEDAFTDAFCGHIADKQLKPYFQSGQLGVGLAAAMEELEARAQMKAKGATRDDVRVADHKLLGGGAGANRTLRELAPTAAPPSKPYPPGKTPQETWLTMIEAWRNHERSPQLGIYCETGKLIYRDFANQPASRLEQNIGDYATRPFSILQHGDAAAVYFGNSSGWANAPFLFARTAEGWCFDLTSQRKFVRMGPAPNWLVEAADHPYASLFNDVTMGIGQDMPVSEQDRYNITRDKTIAMEILALETQLKSRPNDGGMMLALGRLYVIGSLGPRGVEMLKRAEALRPNDPAVHKYIAMGLVDLYYSYDQAKRHMEQYVRLTPQDASGHDFLGFIAYQQGRFDKALGHFNRALALSPDDAYAMFYLSLSHAKLYMQGKDVKHKQASLAMYRRLMATAPAVSFRPAYLKDTLDALAINSLPDTISALFPSEFIYG